MAIEYGEHAADQFSIVIAGILLEGFGKENMFKIEPRTVHRTTVVGLDGHVQSSKMADKSATLTVTLLSTSSAHRKLLALFNQDEVTPGGAGVGSCEITDLINGDKDYSARCYIEQRPTREFSAEPTDVEWTFVLGKWEQSYPL